MVAVAPAASPSSPAPVSPSALAGRGPLVRFTVDDVQSMLRAGLLPEDASTELLDGCIVRRDRSVHGGDPAMYSRRHRYTVIQLTDIAVVINSPDRHVQIQLPIVCGRTQMPEPDFAIVRAPQTAYSNCLPTGADTLCVVELADSSLERDRQENFSGVRPGWRAALHHLDPAEPDGRSVRTPRHNHRHVDAARSCPNRRYVAPSCTKRATEVGAACKPDDSNDLSVPLSRLPFSTPVSL